MAESESDPELTALEAELAGCIRAGEYLDALDLCEEIQDLGKMEVRHWLTMARCLIELRRKADARHAWLKVLELEPDHPKAVEGLNTYFPGWRRASIAAPPPQPIERPRQPPSVPAAEQRPQAAPPPSGALAAPPKAGAAKAGAADAGAPHAAASAPRPAPAAKAPAAPEPKPAAPSSPQRPRRVASVAATSLPVGETEVNWDYILQDVDDAHEAAESV